MNNQIDPYTLLSLVWSRKRRIVEIVTAITLVVLGISFLLPKYYKAQSVLIPETDESKLAGIAGGLSSLAALAGVSVGEVPMEQLYPAIIESESVLREVLLHKYSSTDFSQPVNLIEYWKFDNDSPRLNFELALKRLRDELDVNVDKKTNIVTITILMKEPQLAADVVNMVTTELDKFMRTKRRTSASEQRRWIETRLADVDSTLKLAEVKLKDFREKNRKPDDSPELLMELGRLSRDVDAKTAVYTELEQQYEMARIQEVKNMPIINIMDYAQPAAKKEKPKKSVIVILAFLLSLLGSLAYFIVDDLYGDVFQRVWKIVGPGSKG
jgi:uncharacterized protein involved in exopolysaccharide biosynthesis